MLAMMKTRETHCCLQSDSPTWVAILAIKSSKAPHKWLAMAIPSRFPEFNFNHTHFIACVSRIGSLQMPIRKFAAILRRRVYTHTHIQTHTHTHRPPHSLATIWALAELGDEVDPELSKFCAF